MKCSSPKIVNGRLVSCGRCFCCSSKKASSWSIRTQKDINFCRSRGVVDGLKLIKKSDLEKILGRDCSSSMFNNQTLTDVIFGDCTYNNSFLPVDQSLNRKDFVRFKKRFRKRIKKYFGVDNVRIIYSGEYGEEGTHRPHYHYVIWNLPKCCIEVYRKLVEDAWSMGFCKVDIPESVSNSAHYVAKYTAKSDCDNFYSLRPGESLEDYTARTGKTVPPFVGASMGLGLDYIEKNAYAVAKLGYIPDGEYKVAIPSYYRNKMRAMLDYSIVHAQVKSEVDFKAKQLKISGLSAQELDSVVNYKLLKEKIAQDVSCFKAEHSDLLAYARRLGIQTSGLFAVQSVHFDDAPCSSVKFVMSDFVYDNDAFDSDEEFCARNALFDVLRRVRSDFSKRFFDLYVDLFNFESRRGVDRYLSLDWSFASKVRSNVEAVVASAESYRKKCLENRKLKLERKRLSKYAVFSNN